MYDFDLIVIEFQLVSKHQSGYKMRSLSYLSRVRIDKRGSEKPIGLTAQSFIESSLKM